MAYRPQIKLSWALKRPKFKHLKIRQNLTSVQWLDLTTVQKCGKFFEFLSGTKTLL